MEKTKLRDARKRAQKTQQDLADVLSIDRTGYQKRETGRAKIHPEEWEKLADALGVDVDEIYQPEEGFLIINKENQSVTNNNGTTYIYSIPDFILEELRANAEFLRAENERLRQELENLKKV